MFSAQRIRQRKSVLRESLLLLIWLSTWTLAYSGSEPDYPGRLDVADCSQISGWAWDPHHPQTTQFVDLYDGEQLIDTITANVYRADLEKLGIGKGYHGFVLAIPDACKDGQRHLIRVRLAGTGTELHGSGQFLTCPAYSDFDIHRFLEQSTFGPTEELVRHVRQVGYEAFLEEQLACAPSGYPSMPYMPTSAPEDCRYKSSDPSGPASTCYRDNYTLVQIQLRFMDNALHAPDQLRQRVAFALHQIFVISGVRITQAYAMADFQQILVKNAFGNFRQLLEEVTLNPAMGRYLDMVNNDKPNPQKGISANENYARELLQLFSIGLFQLNPDGTYRLDNQGNPMANYTQKEIENFARVFTGWTYPTLPGATPKDHNPTNFSGTMELYPANHDTDEKTLLNGRLLPAGQSGEKDLDDALDNIFQQESVGPFIGRQLIRHLVTSNPSPAYVSRISAVFQDNGKKVRGDLAAVVKAILLDPEARGADRLDSAFGHLRNPVLFVTHLMRALDGVSDGLYLKDQTSRMRQNLFFSPTVFNYYLAGYTLPTTDLYAPEFAILDATNYFARANFLNSLIFSNGIAADKTFANSVGTRIDLAPWARLTADPWVLIESLNRTLLGGLMPWEMREILFMAVSSVPVSDPLGRARTAVYLIASSAAYQVER